MRKRTKIMEGRVYMNYVHSSTLLKQLTALWKNDLLCDAVLTVDNCIMARAHKIVLLAVSSKLQSDSSSLSQTAFLDVQLPNNVSSQSVETFLKYIYEGYLHITEDNFEDLQNIAVFLQIPTLYKYCKDFSVKMGMNNLHDKDTDSWVNQLSDFSLDDFAQVRIMEGTNKITKNPKARSEIKECDSSKGQRTQSTLMEKIDLTETSTRLRLRSRLLNSNQDTAGKTIETTPQLNYKHNQAQVNGQKQENTSYAFEQAPVLKKRRERNASYKLKTYLSDDSQSQTLYADNMQHSKGISLSQPNISNEYETISLDSQTSEETHIFDTHSGKTFTLSSESDKNLTEFSMSSSSLLRKVLTEMPAPKPSKPAIVASNVLAEILQADSVVPSHYSSSRDQSDYNKYPTKSARISQTRSSFNDEHTSTFHRRDERSDHKTKDNQQSVEGITGKIDKTGCVSASSLLRAIVENQYKGHESSGRAQPIYTHSSKESSPGLISMLQKPPLNLRDNQDHRASDFKINECTEEPSSSDQTIQPMQIKQEPVDEQYEGCSSSGGLRFEITENPVNTSEERENLMGLYMSHVKKEQELIEENSQSSSDNNIDESENHDDPEWHPSKKKRKKVKSSKASYQF